MTEAEQRVLVLGGTGMLGHEAVRRLATAYEVHATVRDVDAAARFALPATLHRFDAFAAEDLPPLLQGIRPAVVLNCIGVVKQLEDASRPVPAITLNALFPHQAADACATEGCRFIHVSTDCVFAGTLPLGSAYTEDDTPDARDLYGRTKLLGEVTGGRALTLRTSIIGWELVRASGLLSWFAAQENQTVKGYTRAHFSGLTTRALSEIVLEICRANPDLQGLYHVAGPAISKFDLLAVIRDRLGIRCELSPVDEPVVNRVLDGTRFSRATGLSAPSWEEMLDAYLDRERRSR